MIPVLTLLSLQLGALLSGAVITEVVFSWPGIGSLLIDAIQQRDYPLIQGVVLVIAILYIVINLVTDVLLGWIDPRIEAQA
jgi:peptide/nickel transport system permease protein